MKLSICTISFRHHLHSIEQIARFAKSSGFQAIELWGVHAKHLGADGTYGKEWLADFELEVSMISDYLPLEGPLPQICTEAERITELSEYWGAKKIRTFAGNKGSAETDTTERQQLIANLQILCEIAHSNGQQLLVETHPNTLADNLQSTLQLIEETDHPALKINFDVLHVWESGAEPLAALKELQPYITHFHLKNIASREQLHVFQPHNVYAAAGSRDGMVPLFKGAVNFSAFLQEVKPLMEIEASLEWFGPNVAEVLKQDAKRIQRLFSLETVSAGR